MAKLKSTDELKIGHFYTLSFNIEDSLYLYLGEEWFEGSFSPDPYKMYNFYCLKNIKIVHLAKWQVEIAAEPIQND